MHAADALIQSDIYCIQDYQFMHFPGIELSFTSVMLCYLNSFAVQPNKIAPIIIDFAILQCIIDNYTI